MTKEMKTFIENIVHDEESWGKFESSKTMKEAFDVAKNLVSELEFEDFNSTMKKLNELENKMIDEELRDKELEQVSAGIVYTSGTSAGDLHEMIRMKFGGNIVM